MRRKKPYYQRMALDVSKFGLTLGVGSVVIGGVGGATAGFMQGQVSALGKYTPAVVSLGIGKGMLRQLRKVKRVRKVKR